MKRTWSAQLVVPAVLSCSSVLVGCPSDDGDDTGAATSSSGTASGTATEATASTGTAGTSSASSTAGSSGEGSSSGDAGSSDAGSSSGVDSGSGDTGALPACTDLADEPSCASETQCIWLPELGGCIRNCEMITDLDVCAMSQGCVVFGDTCGYEPIA